jgi:xanthine dehydrogenase accessory factor
MIHFYGQVARELKQGNDLCRATIISRQGSTPRELGTRFIVRKDGSIWGTIGGGRLEADVILAAGEAMDTRCARLLQLRLKGSDVAESEMICGGDVDVYVEPLFAGDAIAVALYSQAAEIEKSGKQALAVTLLSPGPAPLLDGRMMLLPEHAPPAGHIENGEALTDRLSAEVTSYFERRQSHRWVQSLPGPIDTRCYIEPIISQPVVYLFGGGHISLVLARLVTMVGFRLVVADDRTDFANALRFPEADDLWVKDFNDITNAVDLGPDAYVVIVPRGHLFDKEVLAQVLRKETAYVGMIGSRRKRDMIYGALAAEGIDQAKLSTVHSPIGLDIGAQTPEEIAVSIVAELIAVKAGKAV